MNLYKKNENKIFNEIKEILENNQFEIIEKLNERFFNLKNQDLINKLNVLFLDKFTNLTKEKIEITKITNKDIFLKELKSNFNKNDYLNLKINNVLINISKHKENNLIYNFYLTENFISSLNEKNNYNFININSFTEKQKSIIVFWIKKQLNLSNLKLQNCFNLSKYKIQKLLKLYKEINWF